MGEGLAVQAERIRKDTCALLDAKNRSRLGQFFTPQAAAALVASLPMLPEGEGPIRILDPGAGSGALTAAIVERFVAQLPGRKLLVTAVEIDRAILPALRQTALLCEDWGRKHGVEVIVDVRNSDLVDSATGLGGPDLGLFDLVIMNPPYLKLRARSSERLALAAAAGVECPNLYAAFLALGVLSLRYGGQLVAITPRSFANGPYFGDFRRFLLDAVVVNRVHTFESRGSVFSDNGVLQENIVFSCTKGGDRSPVQVSVSRDHEDAARNHVVAYGDFVRANDPHRFLRITTNGDETAVVERMLAMPATLTDLGIQVSTGRVVDFRARENLRAEPAAGDLPLIYPGNVRMGKVDWPRSINKAQGFKVLREGDKKVLMPPGSYVLVKRFSAKEERRRIVAGHWAQADNSGVAVAFENHLNVFHHDWHGMDRELAWGLTLWLNGSLVDRHFRTFSGHTQVNATDLRSLRFPCEVDLRRLASVVDGLPEQTELDYLIDQTLFGAAA